MLIGGTYLPGEMGKYINMSELGEFIYLGEMGEYILPG